VSAAREHLAAIASAPRPAGSESERRAREYCAGVLRALGFEVAERTFEYSTFPGKWGTPLFGACMASVVLAAACVGRAGSGGRALAILVVGIVIVGIVGVWLGRRGVLDLPVGRARSTNLIATRGAPALWLVAHLDSKSQPIPIGVRAIAITACIVFAGVSVVVAVAQLVVPIPAFAWLALAACELVAAVPVMASVVGARSAGALDDASGVATVLRTVEMLPAEHAIGVLLTSAEELGLAGARAHAREGSPSSAINFDGIDDAGELLLIFSGRRPRALLERLGSTWPAPGRLVPGVLMDGVALAEAGWEVVNVSRGGWRTVGRIHTPRDDLAHLTGRGAEEVAARVASAIGAGAHVGIDPGPH
jgi:hypothetical protein